MPKRERWIKSQSAVKEAMSSVVKIWRRSASTWAGRVRDAEFLNKVDKWSHVFMDSCWVPYQWSKSNIVSAHKRKGHLFT